MEMRESIARADGDRRRRRPLRRRHRRHRAVLARFAGIPLVSDARLSAAVAVVVAVVAALDAAARAARARSARGSTRCACNSGARHPDDHQPHGWARWARRGRPSARGASMIASVVILVGARAPVLNLQLGQHDVGALPRHHGAAGLRPDLQGLRRRHERPAAGRGEARHAGQAGPEQLNQVDQPAEAAPAAAAAAGAAGRRRPDAAAGPAQAQQQTAKQQQQLDAQQKQASSPATDPRLTNARERHREDAGRRVGLPATVDKKGDAAVFTVVPTTAPSDQKTEDLVNNLRDNVIPKAIEGQDDDRLRRRPDRRLHRPRGPDPEKLPSMILIVVGAQLPRADARLPFAAGAAQGGAR